MGRTTIIFSPQNSSSSPKVQQFSIQWVKSVVRSLSVIGLEFQRALPRWGVAESSLLVFLSYSYWVTGQKELRALCLQLLQTSFSAQYVLVLPSIHWSPSGLIRLQPCGLQVHKKSRLVMFLFPFLLVCVSALFYLCPWAGGGLESLWHSLVLGCQGDM